MKTITNALKKRDQIGANIGFTYQNSNQYKTKLGGTLSLLAMLGLLCYFGVLVESAYNQRIVKLNNIEKLINLNQDKTGFNLSTHDNFDLAFRFQTYGFFLKPNESIFQYFNARFFVREQSINTSATTSGNMYIVKTQDFSMTPCTFGRLGGNDTWNNLQLWNWMCPEHFNINVIGDEAAPLNRKFQVEVSACNQWALDNVLFPGQNVTCKPLNESIAAAATTFLYMAYKSQFFDTSDFVNPIKSYVSRDTFSLSYDQAQQRTYYLQENEAQISDSWISSSLNQQTLKYYSMEPSGLQTNQDKSIALIFGWTISNVIKIGPKKKIIQRTVFNLIDAISTIGGFSGTVFLILKVLTSHYQEFSFYSDVISSIFLSTANEGDSNSLVKQEISIDKDKKAPNNESRIDLQEMMNSSSRKILGQQSFDDKLFDSLNARKPFIFTFKDYIKLKLKKIRCRRTITAKEQLFYKSKEKLEQYLDFKNILRKLQTLDVIIDMIFTKSQKKLLPYCKQRLISLNMAPQNNDDVLLQTKNQYELKSLSTKISKNKEKESEFGKKFLRNLIHQHFHDSHNQINDIEQRSPRKKFNIIESENISQMNGSISTKRKKTTKGQSFINISEVDGFRPGQEKRFTDQNIWQRPPRDQLKKRKNKNKLSGKNEDLTDL